MLFVGDVTAPARMNELSTLCSALSQPDSFLRRYTPAGARYDSIFEVLTVHSAKRIDVAIFDFPEVLRPFDEVEGWDYGKIFVDDESYHEGHGHV